MKKLMVAIVLSLSIVLTSCGGSSNNSTSDEKPVETVEEKTEENEEVQSEENDNSQIVAEVADSKDAVEEVKAEEVQEEAPVETETGKAEEKTEETYRTDEFYGCKFSVPDTWVLDEESEEYEGKLRRIWYSARIDELTTAAVRLMFQQFDLAEDQWDSWVDEQVESFEAYNSEFSAINIDECAPLDGAKYPTYYLKGNFTNAGNGPFPYEAYLVYLENYGSLFIENYGVDSAPVKNIIDTLDVSGMSD